MFIEKLHFVGDASLELIEKKQIDFNDRHRSDMPTAVGNEGKAKPVDALINK